MWVDSVDSMQDNAQFLLEELGHLEARAEMLRVEYDLACKARDAVNEKLISMGEFS